MRISKQKQGMTDVHKQMDESLVMFISLKEARWGKKKTYCIIPFLQNSRIYKLIYRHKADDWLPGAK